MEDDFIKRLAAHVVAVRGSIVTVPASEDALRDAEASMGLKIPALLRSIYLQIGNGGFGPGYGVIGVKGGHASNLGTLVDAYTQMKNGASYLGLQWDPKLLPFCEWGCNIFSCVDCSDVHHHVFQSEDCNTHIENYSLKDFFEMWLNGMDILDVDGAKGKTAEVINPFTRKKTRVSSSRNVPK